MTDNEDDSGEILYRCGDCGRAREEENVEMVQHENEELGEYPICKDSPCSIRDVRDPTENRFKVDEHLE